MIINSAYMKLKMSYTISISIQYVFLALEIDMYWIEV